MLQPPKYNQTKTTPSVNDDNNNTLNNVLKLIMIVKSANCKHCPPLDNKTMPSIQLLNTESGRAPQREKSPSIVILTPDHWNETKNS